jgi:hypothetical protein
LWSHEPGHIAHHASGVPSRPAPAALLITAIMERMEGDVEKREVSTGGNGREAEAEKLVPGRQIIGTNEGAVANFIEMAG